MFLGQKSQNKWRPNCSKLIVHQDRSSNPLKGGLSSHQSPSQISTQVPKELSVKWWLPDITWEKTHQVSGSKRVALMAQLVWRHSCGADRLPVLVRFPAGPWVRFKTVDPPKGNGLGQKKRFRVQTSMAYRWISPLQTVTCKNYSSKPFETTSNVPKRFQTPSSNSDILWGWHVHAKQHAAPNTRHSPAQNLLRLIGMIAKTATSSDTTKQSPQIHICRQQIQMLRPK